MCLCVCKRESVWETDRQAETETIYHMSMWYIYTFVSGCVHLLVHIYRGQGKTSHILLYHSICYPLRQGVSLNLKLGWHPASPSYSSISTPPAPIVLGYKYVSAEDSNSCLHAWIATTCLTHLLALVVVCLENTRRSQTPGVSGSCELLDDMVLGTNLGFSKRAICLPNY